MYVNTINFVEKENDVMYTQNDVSRSDMISSSAARIGVSSLIAGTAATVFSFVPVLIPVLLAGATVATVANAINDSVEAEK